MRLGNSHKLVCSCAAYGDPESSAHVLRGFLKLKTMMKCKGSVRSF